MPQVIKRSSHPKRRLITYLLNSAVMTVKIIIVMAIHDSKFNTGPRLLLEMIGVRGTRAVMLTAAMASVPDEYFEDVSTSRVRACQEEEAPRAVSCNEVEEHRSLQTLPAMRFRLQHRPECQVL